MRSHIASLKMHRTHAHCKLLPKGVPHTHRNMLLHIATPQVAAAHRKSCFAIYFFFVFLSSLSPCWASGASWIRDWRDANEGHWQKSTTCNLKPCALQFLGQFFGLLICWFLTDFWAYFLLKILAAFFVNNLFTCFDY